MSVFNDRKGQLSAIAHRFSQLFDDQGDYEVTEQLAVSMNVAVSGLVEAAILEAVGGKARLLQRDELPEGWDPTTDSRTPVWEATQHLVRVLEDDGEAAAGRLLPRLGGLGESVQLQAYQLYTICESARPNRAGPYSALVAAWPEIQRLAQAPDAPVTRTEQQGLDL